MIRFPAADSALVAELRETGLLAPDVLDQIDRSLGRPEQAELDDVLLAGADLISEKTWLTWLIRRHGCHRFGRVAWRADCAGWARPGLPPEGNLPYLRCEAGHVLIAVMRPDRMSASERRYSGLTLLPAAATLPELRELRAAWSRTLRF